MDAKPELDRLIDHIRRRVDADAGLIVEPWLGELLNRQTGRMPQLTWSSSDPLVRLVDPYAFFEANRLGDFIGWGASFDPWNEKATVADLWLYRVWQARRWRFQDCEPEGTDLRDLDAQCLKFDSELRRALN